MQLEYDGIILKNKWTYECSLSSDTELEKKMGMGAY